MGFGDASFQTRQKIGVWGEATTKRYFDNHPEHGITALNYGEASSSTKKSQKDAVCRPDLLLIETEKINELEREGVPVREMNLRDMDDSDPRMVKIVDAALVGLEAKFSHREYREGRVNFIIDENRKLRYETWLSRTRRIGTVMVWFTTNRAFIATEDKVLSEGKEEVRSYEQRGKSAREKKTWNLPVERADPFANVIGYKLNETFKPSFRMTESGAIGFDVDDDPGDLEDVRIDRLKTLAREVKRA